MHMRHRMQVHTMRSFAIRLIAVAILSAMIFLIVTARAADQSKGWLFASLVCGLVTPTTSSAITDMVGSRSVYKRSSLLKVVTFFASSAGGMLIGLNAGIVLTNSLAWSDIAPNTVVYYVVGDFIITVCAIKAYGHRVN